MDVYDVIIIGAGAAGLMSAISAKEEGKSVLILESNPKPGLKILISGGGRCNFTNLNVTPEDFVSRNPHFCKSALNQFSAQDFIKWVGDAKIPYYEKTLGQLFCKTSSKEILHMLLAKMNSPKVKLVTKIQIFKITKNKNQFLVSTNRQTYSATNIIVATGGLSFKKLGASDFGYEIAKQFGHKITNLAPALDGFVLEKNDLKKFIKLSGSSLHVCLTVGAKSFTENILFTHKGISGPAALKGSLYWKKGQKLSIDFIPSIHNFSEWILDLQKIHPKKLLSNVLSQILTTNFVKTALPFDKQIAQVSKNDIKTLTMIFKEFQFIPLSTIGYDKAEVTRGGVDTKDLSSKTMQSKLVPGLFFVGEVVDVTGLLGGYNFQWAWSSGWVAGKNLS